MTAVPTAVTFNYATWIAMFPEFAGVSSAMGQGYFNRAGLYCQNNTCNPAFCSGNLETLLYLLTAHIAWMSAPRDAQGNPAQTGQPASAIVGRINSASEGSVSVGAEWTSSGSPSEAWYVQTKYGADYWQATAQYRTARYVALPTMVGQSPYPLYGGFGMRSRFGRGVW